jgi:hypothetical protein
VGCDHNAEWQKCVSSATCAMTDNRSKASFTPEKMEHRRGDFPSVTAGISFGGGQKVFEHVIEIIDYYSDM